MKPSTRPTERGMCPASIVGLHAFGGAVGIKQLLERSKLIIYKFVERVYFFCLSPES
jgi:hypothetical protein